MEGAIDPIAWASALTTLQQESTLVSSRRVYEQETLTSDAREFAIANSTFSLLDAAIQSARELRMYPELDAAPIDSFEDPRLDATYQALYDDSPLTPTPSSPASSRASSPGPFERPLAENLLAAPSSPTYPHAPVPVSGPSSQAGEKRHGNPNTPSDPGSAGHNAPQPNKKAREESLKADLGSAVRTAPRSNQQVRKGKCNHEHCRKARAAARAANAETGRATTQEKVRRIVLPTASTATRVGYSSADIPSASTGYVALRDSKGKVHTLDDLVNKRGFTLIKADKNQRPRAILDKCSLIIAVIVGAPNDVKWKEIHEEAHQLLLAASKRCQFEKVSKKNRRGKFGALNAGIAFGNGLVVPGNLKHNTVNAEVLATLLSSDAFDRIAGFASDAFKTWAPKLHQYYADNLEKLTAHDKKLRKNFKSSVWAAAAFNCGPRTVTAKHRDCQNLPFGWCSVTAFGDYDYVLGGHAVFWELKLVVEFPPGFTILLPSAAIAHSNTPIQPHETRTSFTQYSSGGIFRWVEHGFQREEQYVKDFTGEDWARIAKENAERCLFGTKLFSTFDELKNSTKSPKDVPSSRPTSVST